ncbi:MAG: hypothetical protein WCT49_04385 [Candidatus Paceibacterota bacterium]|jgi:hypothetical protein
MKDKVSFFEFLFNVFFVVMIAFVALNAMTAGQPALWLINFLSR